MNNNIFLAHSGAIELISADLLKPMERCIRDLWLDQIVVVLCEK